MISLVRLIVLLCVFVVSNSFMLSGSKMLHNSRAAVRMALDENSIQKLDAIRAKYDNLAAIVSPEADAEKAAIADVAEKYATYREIRAMMAKLKTMWRSEASERRRSKQLKSFVQLFEGRLQLEEALKEKLGLPYQKTVPKNQALEAVRKLEAEVAQLESKLETVSQKTQLKAGASTREARFGALP